MIRLIGILLGIVVLVGVVMSGSYLFDTYLISPDKDAQAVSVTIEEGARGYAIAEQLEEQGIISSKLFFRTYVRLSNSVIQAGTFELKPGMSLRSIVQELGYAAAQEVQVTIPEGFTLDQIGEVVVGALPEIASFDWESVVSGQDLRMLAGIEVLNGIPADQGLEGYLFPDTYRFRADANVATVVETMILTLKRRLAENDIAIPRNLIFEGGLTFHEMLTLASIVEREVREPQDMKMVAGIFYTRMKIGMALQADSTVNYVTGKSDTAVSLEDSRVDSPYNTYRSLGLPPGPISNPGMNAMLAVLNPTDSDYLYFLTTDEGEVIYAQTFDEHVANKYQYLK
ncbi:MAG: Aminodeoxychorismate lyase [Candidatus Uhrbacteria bacterium GW2011_GWA2_52_8d]|uniref:Endolytic murein transglycosylase n=1 Tax=Candidatus Uhrbacteria bacterium GW2011_GWA2_52_8d TaxID=1618979 RepID=A0A0G1ZUX0_9BACT|nr:MAG: Aminodeoxychorismate lyase [Candidatus Uhrbacteria bacterium GW2011_GWA2_52_8d]